MFYEMIQLIKHHYTACIDSLKELAAQPMASLLALLVIAIALSLPAFLLLVLTNAHKISGDWQKQQASLTLYLKQDISQRRLNDVRSELKNRPDIAETHYISPDKALEEFKQAAGIDKVVKSMNDNPLPGIIIAYPIPAAHNKADLAQLSQQLATINQVDSVQLNKQWVDRLLAIINVAKRVVYALAVFLVLAVAVIVGNTVYFATQSRQQEIVVFKLVGANNEFIRRPFIYTGLWYGLLGSILAWFFISLSSIWLDRSLQHLALLYSSHWHFTGLTKNQVILLLIIGGLTGSISAYAAVNHYIKHCRVQ